MKEGRELTLFCRVPPPPTTAPWAKAAREKQKVSREVQLDVAPPPLPAVSEQRTPA